MRSRHDRTRAGGNSALVLAALGWQSWRLNEASHTIDKQGNDLKVKRQTGKNEQPADRPVHPAETNNREQARLYAAAESTTRCCEAASAGLRS
jgi:hypothetical protein